MGELVFYLLIDVKIHNERYARARARDAHILSVGGDDDDDDDDDFYSRKAEDMPGIEPGLHVMTLGDMNQTSRT